jgi:hypothetical protein
MPLGELIAIDAQVAGEIARCLRQMKENVSSQLLAEYA